MPGIGSSATWKSCDVTGTSRRRARSARPPDSNDRAGATIDVDGDAGDEGAGVRAQEAGHARELLGLAHAAKRNAALGHAVDELLVGLALARRGLVAARPLVALDQAHQHGIHQHAVLGVLLAHRL